MKDEDRRKSYLLDIKDTIVWAKLSLEIISPKQAKNEIELLMRDKIIAPQWKEALKKRYDFYDRFPEHKEKVDIQV